MSPTWRPRNVVIHGDCVEVMRRMAPASVDFVLTDPPYLVRYRDRSGRTVANDDNDAWLKPAFAEMYRVLKPGTFCMSFYGWNAADRVWMGHERKRGKLGDLDALLLAGDRSPFSRIAGDLRALGLDPSSHGPQRSDIRHVIALDTDTQLPPGAARALTGIMAHPLNRPVHDPRTGLVVAITIPWVQRELVREYAEYIQSRHGRTIDAMKDYARRTGTRLWINHDKEQHAAIPKAPAFVE